MPKKVENQFHAELRLNGDKGGAWLATVKITDETGNITKQHFSAWKNPSAAKKWVKEKVKEMTPRKSISFLGTNLNDKNKPTLLTGSLNYKVDA